MNQIVTYSNAMDAVPSRRYTGFPLNSTLVSSYTPDTIRSIITHAAAGQPYTTAVWIRISRLGIRISAQDPQVASTRVPVFIPIALAHDIFMQPNINNVICIVYDELQSNMKGVLLYVVQPADAQLLRDDFRLVKQASNAQQVQPSSYSNPPDTRFVNGNTSNLSAPLPPTDVYSNRSPFPVDNNNPMFSPLPSRGSPAITTEVYRNGNLSGTPVQRRQSPPRRIFYVRDNETGINRTLSPSTGVPAVSNYPQLSYTPFRGSYSNREEAGHRRHKSPRKNRQTTHSAVKPSSDSGGKLRRKYRSRSPEKQPKTRLPVNSSSQELTQDQILQQQLLLQQQQMQQQMAAWQSTQMAPVPMGIYNRYVPKTIPLPTGETLKTTAPIPSATGGVTNGSAIAYIEPKTKPTNRARSRSPSPSRSLSPQAQQRNRPSSAHNADASVHHHHHHHRRNHGGGTTNSKPETNLYGTISHSSRSRMKYPMATTTTTTTTDDNDLKQYLKLLLDEVQTVKTEMNKMRHVTTGIPKGRSDSLRIDLKEIRADIDHIRSRMAMTPQIAE